MDAKNLKNIGDILAEIKPHIYGDPRFYAYRDIYSKLVSQNPPSSVYDRDKEIKKIRDDRFYTILLNNYLDLLNNSLTNPQSTEQEIIKAINTILSDIKKYRPNIGQNLYSQIYQPLSAAKLFLNNENDTSEEDYINYKKNREFILNSIIDCINKIINNDTDLLDKAASIYYNFSLLLK
jgi:hypothetical protein